MGDEVKLNFKTFRRIGGRVKNMKSGIELIGEERKRQIQEEGFDNDDWRTDESLAMAAAAYATPEKSRLYQDFYGEKIPEEWPFKSKWWKPTPENRIRELQKAGALIAAEIDRLQHQMKTI